MKKFVTEIKAKATGAFLKLERSLGNERGAYTGTVKPPVRRSGNRGSGMAGTAHYAA